MDFFDPQLLFEKHIIQTISFIGAIQGLVLSVVVLFYPTEHKISNRILSAFILSLSIILLYSRLVPVIGVENSWPIEGTKFSSLMLLYLYIKSLYNRIDWKKEWWHLAITVGYTAFSYLHIHYHIDNQLSLGYDDIATSRWKQTLMGLNFLIPGFYYFSLFRLHRAYREKVMSNFSSTHNIGLKWTSYLIWIHLLLLLKSVFVLIYYLITMDSYLMPVFGLLNNLGFTAYMYYIAIKGKLTPEIYQLRLLEAPVEENTASEGNLPNENLNQLAATIMSSLNEEKIFKEEGLTVKDLAEKINAQPYLVSQAINTVLKKSFFELINSCRVEEARRLMSDPSMDHLSMVGIAFEAGFNSKTAFNTAFKKYTNMTPSEYKRNISRREDHTFVN